MHPPEGQSTLTALIAEQRMLESLVHHLAPCAGDVLIAGDALLAFADREDEAFSLLAPLLDPAARQELETEHQKIAEDLMLLDWLARTLPESPDIAALAESLLRRMQQHIERDGRFLARASGLGPRA